MNKYVIRSGKEDDVVTALRDLKKGLYIEEEDLTLLEDIPAGYKCAAKDISRGSDVHKYGTFIGYASKDIKKGEKVHNHNLAFGAEKTDYAFCEESAPVSLISPEKRRSFMGIKRAGGLVGTRNYIGVLVCSNCAATVARGISDYFDAKFMESYPFVDGVVPFITGLGCGMELSGEPMDLLRRTIAGYIKNPNMGGAVLVALGCERNNIDALMESEGLKENEFFKRLVIQEEGGTKAAIFRGIEEVKKMLPVLNEVRREKCSAEHLLVALQCGGSDGFSGLSANPALGRAMDILVENGGSCILSETTEIFGAEHVLTRRAVSRKVGEKIPALLNRWLERTKGRDCQINGTVSPGNNKGGITNVLEKSLGGVKKCGSTPLAEVYEYAYPVKAKGLSFMDTPGYDPISATGQIAGGANFLCFTTGRGSCYGSALVPVIKIASNSALYEKMTGDMDVNCGEIIDGKRSIDEMGEFIFEEILLAASGRKTKSELCGVGKNEFIPWPIGVFA